MISSAQAKGIANILVDIVTGLNNEIMEGVDAVDTLDRLAELILTNEFAADEIDIVKAVRSRMQDES